MPGEAETREFYRNEYRRLYKGALQPKPHHVLRGARAARDRLQWLAPHLQSVGRWLDVGAGSGEFAFLMRRKGMQVLALEPNLGYAGFVRQSLGIEVQEGFLEDLDPAGGQFDGISLFHVLEHHPDPVGALARLRAMLAPGGILALEVPNAEFDPVHPEKRFHPAHLVAFCRENLEASALAAGLAPAEIRASADGGVLFGVFHAAGIVRPVRPSPALVSRLLERERSQSRLRYYSSPIVWARTIRRLTCLVAERFNARSAAAPQAFLERFPLR